LIRNEQDEPFLVNMRTEVFSEDGLRVAENTTALEVAAGGVVDVEQVLNVPNAKLWDVDDPHLYTIKLSILSDAGQVIDDLISTFGIRYFYFDPYEGFILNGRKLKINGVCMHHDLGPLGAAINTRAMERQLEILRNMGVNAIRTAHNPPAPELLQLCDAMGFMVMNETFDAWALRKTDFDYSVFWDEWHEQDLRDHILRDRNHPSVFIWSIGNEILEQWHPQGVAMTTKLVDIVKSLDPTRPVTAGNNHASPDNSLIASGALDLIGYNYKHEIYADFHKTFPGKSFIAAETTSALATRGSYDMPSDSIRRWPYRWDIRFTDGNPDNSCSSYDNCHAPWGSTHGDTWKVVKKHDFLSGMFIWTGFDYLGEPTPYEWPSRSSYFGVVDLAGFPKDAYYMYQSEWTDQTVLHIFPHWNWNEGQVVDVWAYYNQADEVELFLNDRSLGTKRKTGDDLHVQWPVAFEPGTLRAESRRNGQVIATKKVFTAGDAAGLRISADRNVLTAGGDDLSFITIDIVDEKGNLVPHADNLVSISLTGDISIAGVDNGSQISHAPFQAKQVAAFNGKCLVIVRSGKTASNATVRFEASGLKAEAISLEVR
jgi:beta-galactosidase